MVIDSVEFWCHNRYFKRKGLAFMQQEVLKIMRYFAFVFTFMVMVATAHASSPVIEIYTIPGCTGCVLAKSLLEEKGIPYKEISIRGRPDLYAEMKRRAGGDPNESMTVPRIFINGKHIGGYGDLSSLDTDELMGKQTPSSE